MYKNDKIRWKTIVNEAFSTSSDLEEGSEEYTSKKNLVDSMYRLDPSFAKELVKSQDVENKENRMNKLLTDQYDILQITDKIKNNQNLETKQKENSRKVISGVYNALKTLNSDRITTRRLNEIMHYLAIGNKLPLLEVFPVYMYYLANCAKTYKEKILSGNVENIHRENFKEVVNSTNLIQLLSNRRKFSESGFRNYFIDEEFSSNKAIKPKSREEALNFISSWMKDEVEDFIYIIDPYFKKEDLEI